MNTKVNKIVKLAAAGLFLLALAINVKVTLEDPFAMVSEQAMASDGGGSDSSDDTDDGVSANFYKIKDIRTRSVNIITSISGTLSGGITIKVGDIFDSSIELGSGVSIEYGPADQYKIVCLGTSVVQEVECLQQDWETCASGGCPTN
ncbi:hypothetical protein Q4Q35_13150 [Flavivirga aquimarina]|uniref:Uncharacterized protein n=1 Tax=Flavivirga aquimarina TaxID=2027862 RepID=A0ABT8WCB1_9FLAO|nr:hypothetical protein [Flavivirga aquimarina]MDO5970758.1 hypothetical protein [Flavivirga aquimarina]